MSLEVISTQDPKSGRSFDVEYDFGSTLAEAVTLFGEEVVFSNFKRQGVISLQAIVRTGLKGEASEEEITRRVAAWKPGVVSRSSKSKAEKITDLFGALSEADKIALLQRIQAEIAASKG